jgi:6-phosphogluconolactonase
MTDLMPQLPGSVCIAKKDALFDDLALAVMAAADAAIAARGVFHLALSGGSTPEPFYMGLVIDPRYRELPWDKTHIWIVDERRVADDDERLNAKMIRETLVDHVPMRQRQFHPMQVMEQDPAGLYIEELCTVFDCDTKGAPPRLDFVLLGMGDDAHTASLFPKSDALHESEKWIAVNEGDAVTPPPRVTMTYPLLNAAGELAVLLVGAKKQATIEAIEKQLSNGGPDIENMPITGIEPASGHLTWYLDDAAAGVAD